MEKTLASLGHSEGRELGQYRSVSRLAIVALLLGLASGLSMLHPILFVVPVVAIPTGLAALRHLRQRQDVIIGGPLAIVGLCLALLFGALGSTDLLISRVILTRQARALADSWCALLQQGATRQAHQWTLASSGRRAPGIPLDDVYVEGSDNLVDFEAFLNTPMTARMVKAGQAGQVRYRGLEGVDQDPQSQLFRLRYDFASSDQKAQRCIIMVRRSVDPDTFRVSWRIQSIASDAAE